METIFALATARGRAGVAIVRISGPLAMPAAAELCGALPVEGRGLRRVTGRGGEVIPALRYECELVAPSWDAAA